MRVDFYHLEQTSLDNALPQVLAKAYESGQRILIRTDLAEHADYLNTLLWTTPPDSFLPHGVDKDGYDESQPVFLTHKAHFNPNHATLCVCVDSVPVPLEEDFVRVLYFFNGRDEVALQNAREQWRLVTDKGIDRFYWQQNEQGRWEQKA